MFRKFLIFLRKQYNNNLKQNLIIVPIVFAVSVAASFIIDALLPFNGLWNVLRTIVVIPLSLSIFVGFYYIGYYLHLQRMEEGEWEPFRERLSVSWRRKIAAIIFALLVVFIYALGFKVGYTFSCSIIVAICCALFAFIRTTKAEEIRERLNIPDKRDLAYNEKKQQVEELQAKAEAEKKENKSKKRYEKWGYKDKNYHEDEE